MPVSLASALSMRQLLALAGRAALQLDDALLQPLRADDQLPGQADHVHGRELGAAALVAVVVERLDAGRLELRVESIGSAPRRRHRRRAC